MMWAGSLLWLVALAKSTDQSGERITEISVPFLDIVLPGTVASISLILMGAYFWWHYSYELSDIIRQSSKLGHSISPINVETIRSKAHSDTIEFEHYLKEWKRVAQDSKAEIEKFATSIPSIGEEFSFFSANLAEIESAMREIRQAVHILPVSEGFSHSEVLPAFDRLRIATARLDDIIVSAESLKGERLFSAGIKETFERWFTIPDKIERLCQVEIESKRLLELFTTQVRDLTKLSESYSGSTRRKFRFLDRYLPQIFVGSGMILIVLRWWFGVPWSENLSSSLSERLS